MRHLPEAILIAAIAAVFASAAALFGRDRDGFGTAAHDPLSLDARNSAYATGSFAVPQPPPVPGARPATAIPPPCWPPATALGGPPLPVRAGRLPSAAQGD